MPWRSTSGSGGRNASGAAIAEIGMQSTGSRTTRCSSMIVCALCGLRGRVFHLRVLHAASTQAAFAVCDHLVMKKTPYESSRIMARNNLYHYLPPLAELCPSFKSVPLGFKCEPGWRAMNPSVTVHGNELTAIVRTVNYEIVGGRYHIDGNYNLGNDNPIRTRNWLIELDKETFQQKKRAMVRCYCLRRLARQASVSCRARVRRHAAVRSRQQAGRHRRPCANCTKTATASKFSP